MFFNDELKDLRRRKVSPQPWKLEVPRYLDFEDEYRDREDEITQEVFIDDPELYMKELSNE